ncbi:hypothetical protein DID88_002890 [Monilinia fructigena]|uniref:Rho-GAP domain-containing protein n=1 Tax=Monilinia fructigena TaxID=38457 RepID=A0A395INF5_9HELO|nr:hypothetical protein DID88_002890 [Monilinia fructigena]
MLSDHPASSTTHQAFSSPQPAPIQQATSPPTKQSLKNWWKGFRPPAKTQEPSVESQPTGIFGVPLRQSIAYANVAISLVDAQGQSYIYGYVPIVVAKCGVYLKEKATNVEGIFRLSGLDWAGYTVHDAANVLRRYLNLLPEPIVPLDLYSRFREPLRGHTMAAVGDSDGSPQFSDNFDVNKAIVTYQQLITELPPLNRPAVIRLMSKLCMRLRMAVPSPWNATTPGRSKTTIRRSASNASAGADSVRKFGGIRRNVSVSSRHSRQSNGAPSPASPAYGVTLTSTSSGGIHRSNTVPSKRSPGLPSARINKQSGPPSPSPVGLTTNRPNGPRALSPGLPPSPGHLFPSSSGLALNTATESSLSNSAHTVTSQERLIPRIKKKRIPGSSNPSAQSSTNSLDGRSASMSPGLRASRVNSDHFDHPRLENLSELNPILSNTQATPPATETPRAEQPSHFTPMRPEDPHHPSDRTLRPVISPVSSLHSHSSFNDQSDLDHVEDPALAEAREKRSLWRLSRRRDDSNTLVTTLSPRKNGSDSNAGASSSSVGSSSRPRKSFTGDTVPVGPDSGLSHAHIYSSNESGSVAPEERRSGPLGWIKSKMREKRDESREKGAERERNKSPPGDRPTNISSSALAPRGKSIEINRGEEPERPHGREHASPQ